LSNMEMSSAPDTRRRPHRAYLAPGGKRDGWGSSDFKGVDWRCVKNFYKLRFLLHCKKSCGVPKKIPRSPKTVPAVHC
jgi:hypothetical protein